MKLMFVGAHPDDGDLRMAGLACRYVERGGEAVLVSLTNGNAGHQTMRPDELEARRREEARRAGEAIGARYLVLDHDDGRLTASIEAREELIRLIRAEKPDLLLALRPYDYHPDHRAAGQLVLDAAYLLTVPLLCPDAPILESMPVIAYVYDAFRPPFRADVAVGVDEYLEKKLDMIACHESQVFEWLPYNRVFMHDLPPERSLRRDWMRDNFEEYLTEPVARCRDTILDRYGLEAGQRIVYAEFFEISEYGAHPDAEDIERLFPM